MPKFLFIYLFSLCLAINKEEIYDNSYALIIGIDKYQNVRELDYTVKDAEAVESMLTEIFQFKQENIKMLKNDEATKTTIIQEFSNINQKAEGNDRVLIFFAGHGETLDLPGGGEKGYLLPVEGDKNNLYLTAIPMDELREIALMSEAKHMLYLVDACYGGLASVGSRGLAQSVPRYIDKITQYKSRQIISAGGKGEEVIEKAEWGHSAFTKNLISGLRDMMADSDDDGIITTQELGTYLKRKVTIDSDNRQTPKIGNLTNEEGEFVFFPSTWKNNAVEVAAEATQKQIPIPTSLETITEKGSLESQSYILDLTDINLISGMGQLGLFIDDGKKEIYLDFGTGIGRKVGTKETFVVFTTGLMKRHYFNEFGTVFIEYGLHVEYYMYKYENKIAEASIIDPNIDEIGIKPLIGVGFVSPLKIFKKRVPIIKSFTFGYRFVPQELEQVGVSSGPTVALRVGYFKRQYQENYIPEK